MVSTPFVNIRLATEQDLAAFAARKAADRAALAALPPREAQQLVGFAEPEKLRVLHPELSSLRSVLCVEGGDIVE